MRYDRYVVENSNLRTVALGQLPTLVIDRFKAVIFCITSKLANRRSLQSHVPKAPHFDKLNAGFTYDISRK